MLSGDAIPTSVHHADKSPPGQLKSPAKKEEGSRNTPFIRTGREEQVSVVLDNVAKRHGLSLTSIALAYALQKVLIAAKFVIFC
jgi:aryl-alcohol dehydrogenase-like predicted oxidoreductase